MRAFKAFPLLACEGVHNVIRITHLDLFGLKPIKGEGVYAGLLLNNFIGPANAFGWLCDSPVWLVWTLVAV